MSYIVDFFREIGFDATEVEPENYLPLVDVIRIKNDSPPVLTFLKWSLSESNLGSLEIIKRRLRSILLKGIKFDSEVYNHDRLDAFVSAYYPLLTPQEKLDKILEYVDSLTKYDGERVTLDKINDTLATDLLFNGLKEFEFYLRTALNEGLLKTITGTGNTSVYNLSITGLSRLITIKEQKSSKTCFIAMAFEDDLNTIYTECIVPVVIGCGFEPYIVNRIHMDSDKTINDGILAGIKKARFTIADFTYTKAGVYFEAGFALGRGQKVIYSCRHDFIDKLHFDSRNYQHIVWKDIDDFKIKLRDKIEAFIID